MNEFEFETITDNVCKLHITKEVEIDNGELVKSFIIDLMNGIAEQSQEYAKVEGLSELPYTFNERQLESVVLPTLSKICNGLVLTELPVKRKVVVDEDNDRSSGRADYWCIYNDYTFIIEVKYSKDIFTTSVTRNNSVINRWNTMLEQLHSIDKEVRNICKEHTKGIIRLGLHFIASYSNKKPDEMAITDYRENINNTLVRISEDLRQGHKNSRRPSIMACWEIPAPLIMMDPNETFPGLVVAAKIIRSLRSSR